MAYTGVYSPDDLARCFARMGQMPLPFEWDMRPLGTEKRSLPQNALSHVWYYEIGRDLEGWDTVDARRHCKLHYGIPILRGSDPDFQERYDRLIRDRLTLEEKLELMDWFPVTRLMKKDQMTEYMDRISAEFAPKGVRLQEGR